MQHYKIFVASFKMVLADDELSASLISKESAVVIDSRSSTVSGGMTDSHASEVSLPPIRVSPTPRDKMPDDGTYNVYTNQLYQNFFAHSATVYYR